jgi:hypothetical protein
MNSSLGLKRSSTFLVLLFAITLISMIFIASPKQASADVLSQCNGTDNVGGQAVECHYTVTNNLNGGVTSSSTTIQECHGAANDPPTMVCTNSTSNSPNLVTSVNQCNGSGSGGGGTVLCTVDVINNITGSVTPTGATVNQCNTSGQGGGTAPTTLCDPDPATTSGATVTQCNGSGNKGGGTMRVRCDVDAGATTTSVLNVTVNQCNGSGNGGGATVTCRTNITNVVTAAPTTTTTTPTTTTTTSPEGGSNQPTRSGGIGETDSGGAGRPRNPGNVPGGSTGGGGGTGTPASDSGTTSQVVHVPVGGAATGGGSTSGLENLRFMLLGLMMVAAAWPALIIRRRNRPQA